MLNGEFVIDKAHSRKAVGVLGWDELDVSGIWLEFSTFIVREYCSGENQRKDLWKHPSAYFPQHSTWDRHCAKSQKDLPSLLHIPTPVVEAFAVIAYGFPIVMRELDTLPQNIDYCANTDPALQIPSIIIKSLSSNATEMLVGEVKKPFKTNGGGLGVINMLKARDIKTQHAKTLMKQSDEAKGMIGEGPRVAISFSKRNWYNDKEVDINKNPEYEHHVIWNHGPELYVDPHHNRKFCESILNQSTLPHTSPIRKFFAKTIVQLKGVIRPASTETALVLSSESPIVVADETPPDVQINCNGKRTRDDWVCDVGDCGRKLKLSTTGKETLSIRKHKALHE
jgi:hypothetical protein